MHYNALIVKTHMLDFYIHKYLSSSPSSLRQFLGNTVADWKIDLTLNYLVVSFATILYPLFTLNSSYNKLKQAVPLSTMLSQHPMGLCMCENDNPPFTLPTYPCTCSCLFFKSQLSDDVLISPRQEHLVLHFNIYYSVMELYVSLPSWTVSRAGNLDLFMYCVLGP